METIFRPSVMKIMRLFYGSKEKGFHLREIARQTGMNENNVTRFLKMIVDAKILKSVKDGNLKKFSIVRGDKVYGIFSLLDVERFEAIPSLNKTAIGCFLQTLDKPPVIAFLFGSIARENSHKKSDIDILLIVNEKINSDEAEKEAESQTGIRVQPFIMKFGDFVQEIKLKEDRVVQSALNTGFPISNHILFYQTIYNGN